MSGRSGMPLNVVNIPAEYSFADLLARHLISRHGGELQDLSRVTVLTPTRRAARSLQNAFLRETAGKPLMLPRMRPLGDVAEDELLLEGEVGVGGAAESILSLPPAIDPLRRQLLLTRLVEARGAGGGIAEAAGLARALAHLLDQVQTEGLDLTDLKSLVPSEYAAHWQITLEFLKILSESWPAILTEEGSIDPALRRDMLLRAQAQHWREHPPEDPVYAVGSTGSIPATAELLHCVANLPAGCVVLPGLDRHLEEAGWQAVGGDPAHAQYALKKLLDRFGLSRADVADLRDETVRTAPDARLILLAEALRPAETTDRWRAAAAPPKEALEGLRRIDCHDAESEAEVIALLLREALETPERTAVLITPDRDLSRRVSSELKRWDVVVDDSAGIGLDQSPPGVFLRLVARFLAEQAAPVPLLAALKHPLAAGGGSAGEFRRHVRELELAVLRGPSPGEGFDGIARALDAVEARAELRHWFAALREAAVPIMMLMSRKKTDFASFVTEFIRFAEKLSTAAEGAEPALWAGAFGEAAASFVSELLRAADVMEEISPAAWPDLLDVLMAGRMVRPRQGQHPRLQIWGPIEGRLGRADLVIMGGLNEGSWPPEAASDPWMSRPMREKFGLPLPEQRLGLSAHDFQQAFAARQVVLTRAEKIDGTPTVPSRWLLRLEALLTKSGLSLETGNAGAPDWQRALDRPDGYHPVSAPRPTPPVGARPRHLSVTRIEKWIKDPYSIFAGEILKLKPLDDIAMDPSAADRGTFIHAALETFLRKHPEEIPANALDLLLDYGREAFGDALLYPAVWAFWWPRFERIAAWFIEFERSRREIYRARAIEAKGTIGIPAPQGTFTLSGRVDRIDRHMTEGTLSILDYKTGSLPSVTEVTSGVTPQLALEAAMIKHGGFPELSGDEVTELAYIRLGGGDPAGKFRAAGGADSAPAAEMAAEAYDGLQRLIAQFDRQATAYLSRPRPELPDRFNEYEHLARVKEWSSGEEGEE